MLLMDTRSPLFTGPAGPVSGHVEANVNTRRPGVKGCVQMEGIGARLKRVRDCSGLGTRPFAERLKPEGVSVKHSTVASYERASGTEKIPGDYLAAVCRAFGVNPGWLLLDRGPVYDADRPAKERAFDLMAEIARLTGGADAERVAAAWEDLQHVESLIEPKPVDHEENGRATGTGPDAAG